MTQILYKSGKYFFAAVLFAGLVNFLGANEPIATNLESRVDALLARMTLEEKVGQMCQYVGIELLQQDVRKMGKMPTNADAIPMYPGLTFGALEDLVRQGKVSSFLHVTTPVEANRLQALAAETRLKIPLIIGIDAIHGDGLVSGATIYPASLGLASSFDESVNGG